MSPFGEMVLGPSDQKLYKFTNSMDQTGGKAFFLAPTTQWGEGITNTPQGFTRWDGSLKFRPFLLCSPTVVHGYLSPIQWCIYHHVVGNHLWVASGHVVLRAPDKVGCDTLTTWYRVRKPTMNNKKLRATAKFVIDSFGNPNASSAIRVKRNICEHSSHIASVVNLYNLHRDKTIDQYGFSQNPYGVSSAARTHQLYLEGLDWLAITAATLECYYQSKAITKKYSYPELLKEIEKIWNWEERPL